MKLDEIYIVYENGGKYFKTYSDAWNNHYKSNVKRVNYVFTPTQRLFKNTSLLYAHANEYFKSLSCNYIDILHKQVVEQMILFDV